jgi:aminopeptidase N
MKQRHIFFILLALVIVGTSVTLAGSDNDTLPLGPSKYKLLIDKVEKDQIMRTDTGELVKLEDIIEQNMDTDVFIIGEAHDNYQCHTFQRDFIETLYKKYPKLIVGFEFFWREDDPILEQWRQGQISEDDVIQRTGWYKRGGQHYGYTRLIMDVIKKYKIKTIGLNVPRSILRTISRKGFAQLTEDEKKLFPTIDIPNPEHEYFIKSIFGTIAAQVPMWFTNIYNAQKCWDVIMAESMRQTLAKDEFKGYKGVIIAGSNHVVYKLGIPFRYAEADKTVKLTTIVPVLLNEEKKPDEDDEDPHSNPMMKMMGSSLNPIVTFSRGIADYVFCAYHPLDSHFPVFGFTVDEKDGQLIVTQVSKDSIAEKNGIKKGDRIIGADGTDITTLEQLRLIITKKEWDNSIDLKMIKTVNIKKE